MKQTINIIKLWQSAAFNGLVGIKRIMNKFAKAIFFTMMLLYVFSASEILADDGTGSSIIYASHEQAQNYGGSETANLNPELRKDFSLGIGEVYEDKCPPVSVFQEKWTAGCWSCLVVEKLTTAFLMVASQALPVCEDAGRILLTWGFIIWLCFWALKNVASFTEIKGGNVLNDLLRMGGKVVIAYFCISMGTTAIREFVITPIMGVGATIAQNFWSDTKNAFTGKSVKDYTQPFLWEDEIVTPEQAAILRDKIEESYTTSETNENGNTSQGTNEEAPANPPQEVVGDPDEATVQLFQRAHIAILKQQLQTIRTSCTNPAYVKNGECSDCRYTGCADKGHQSIIRSFFTNAKRGSMVAAYCICSITSALETLNKEICGDEHDKSCNIANFNRSSSGKFNGVPDVKGKQGIIGCGVGIDEATKYKNAVIGGNRGHDVDLCSVAKNANVGDIVYLYNVDGDGNAGSASGYHAVTHLQVSPHNTVHYLGFNGDTKLSGQDAWFFRNPKGCQKGVIVKTGEIIRQRLKAHQGVKINMKRLKEIAEGSGINQSWINYTGGDGSSASGGSSSYDANSLVVDIGDVTYTGPTDIMPKSIMNSMLGATKAITDTTAQMQILGDLAMCYSNLDPGGRWVVLDKWYLPKITMINIAMWIDGLILFVLGAVLTAVVGFYLVDITFKIGFAVLALPVVMGLWPFKVTGSKLQEVISIIARSSALFAFLALTTYFGIEILVAALGGKAGLEGIYSDFETIFAGEVDGDERDEIIETLNNQFNLFSSSFIMMLFGCVYAYKMIKDTTSDLVEKFYPDKVFGDANPMHKGMTGLASVVNKINKKWGTGLARDVLANKAGQGIKNLAGLGKNGMKGSALGLASKAVAAPLKGAGKAASWAKNKIKGGK